MFKDIFDNNKLFPPGSPFKDMSNLYDKFNNYYEKDKNRVSDNSKNLEEPVSISNNTDTTNPLKPKLRG